MIKLIINMFLVFIIIATVFTIGQAQSIVPELPNSLEKYSSEGVVWRGYEFKFKYTNHRVRQFGQGVEYRPDIEVIEPLHITGTGIGNDEVVFHNHMSFIKVSRLAFCNGEETMTIFTNRKRLQFKEIKPPTDIPIGYACQPFINGFTIDHQSDGGCELPKEAACCVKLANTFSRGKKDTKPSVKKIKHLKLSVTKAANLSGNLWQLNGDVGLICPPNTPECNDACEARYSLTIHFVWVYYPKLVPVKNQVFSHTADWETNDTSQYPKRYETQTLNWKPEETLVGIQQISMEQTGDKISHFEWWSSFVGLGGEQVPFNGDVANFQSKRGRTWNKNLAPRPLTPLEGASLTAGLAFYPWHKRPLPGPLFRYGAKHGGFKCGSHACEGGVQLKLGIAMLHLDSLIQMEDDAEILHFKQVTFSKSSTCDFGRYTTAIPISEAAQATYQDQYDDYNIDKKIHPNNTLDVIRKRMKLPIIINKTSKRCKKKRK